MSIRKLTKQIINERLSHHRIVLLDNYVDSGSKLRFMCEHSHVWLARPHRVMKTGECPECKKSSMKNRVISMLASKGIEMISEYVDQSSPTLFRCRCGHEWNSIPIRLQVGGGCPRCAGKAPITKDIINHRLESKKITIIGDYVDTKTKTEFECELGHVWTAKPNTVLTISGCPECALLKKRGDCYSRESFNEIMVANKTGITMIGEYHGNKTKTMMRCRCGNEWEAAPGRVVSGSGCPKCTNYGFKIDQPAWTYVFTRDNYLKFGITNNLESRLGSHSVHGEFVLVNNVYYQCGKDAKQWESFIKKKFGGRFATKDQCPDGYTETLSVDKLTEVVNTMTKIIDFSE